MSQINPVICLFVVVVVVCFIESIKLQHLQAIEQWLQWEEKKEKKKKNHFFEALNGAFEVQFFQGFIFTPYQRHW